MTKKPNPILADDLILHIAQFAVRKTRRLSHGRQEWQLSAEMSDLGGDPTRGFVVHGTRADVRFVLDAVEPDGDGDIAGWSFRAAGGQGHVLDRAVVSIFVFND